MFKSLLDRMKEGFLIQFGIVPRTLRLQSLLAASQSIKSSSSMKQTIPLPSYSSSCERLLRSSQETADLSLPAITRTKSLNPSTVDVLSSNLESKESKKQISQHAFSNVLTQFWNKRRLNLIRRSLPN